jgi:uncharacterized protein (DUF1330 family)
VVLAGILLGASCGREEQGQVRFDIVGAVGAWVDAWNTRDLDRVEDLFLTDSTVTYFSSEREGLIRGIDAVREHHVSMGFVAGGAPAESELWIEDAEYRLHNQHYVVTAVWYFGDRAASRDSIQRGPMTAVYVRVGNNSDHASYRIGHMHFSEYQERTMPAYVIANISVTDPVQYEDYKKLAGPSVAAYDGKYLVRGGTAEVLEGAWTPNRIVVLEFPSIERAKEWWNSSEYAAAIGIRHVSAESDLILVEGY